MTAAHDTQALAAPEERDLAHEADMERLRREQLRADISPEEAAAECLNWDAGDDWEDEPVCARCRGDGMDPWNDYLFECPDCQGRQQP